jgi:hypothetical protein
VTGPKTDHTFSSATANYLFLSTVAANKASFTNREIKGADKARALYRKIGPPSENDFNDILDNDRITNCPLTSDDAKRAVKIYGPAVRVIKGKGVKKQKKGIQSSSRY